mgnify:CR=1 FL=1
MADNLEIYNKVRVVPPKAQKAITGGRLRGMTDINPMWRIKQLTEQFGPCGVGWKYVIRSQWLEKGSYEQIAAFIDIDLYYKYEGQWSEAIPGQGGSMFVAKEKDGPYTSDECYKMALTDALSVACKALGFGADVYWNGDSTKYDKPTQAQPAPQPPKPAPKAETPKQPQERPVDMTKWWMQVNKLGLGDKEVHAIAGRESLKGMSREELTELYAKCKIVAAERDGK